VFVATAARCGSTLLRYLLDSHPEVACPPELNLSALMQHIVEVWTQTNAALGVTSDNGRGPAAVPPSPEVCRRARRAVDEIMVTAANAAGASVYCDKSLTTVDHLATVSRCYPNASFVFLYRYPLDMIASGLEASKWGFNAFGFGPFVAASPGNFIGALGNYWIDRVSKMVAFEQTCEQPHARIYYELLCDEPAQTMAHLFEFLGVRPEEDVIEQAFESDHGRGPGDYKIDFSGSIAMDSIGRGAALPEALNEAQVARIDELLAHLDYPALAEGRRADLGSLLGLKQARRALPDSREIAESIVRRLAGRPSNGLAERYVEMLPIRLVIRGSGSEHPVVLVREDGTASIVDQGMDDIASPRIRCAGDVLLRVADGKVNFAQAVQDNLIRVEAGNGAVPDRPERPHRVLAALAALMRT
jgi:Sulfotransferase family